MTAVVPSLLGLTNRGRRYPLSWCRTPLPTATLYTPSRCVLNLYYFFLSYNIYKLKADDDGPIRMDHEPRRRSLDSGRGPKASSIISTISFTGGHAANEDDMWSFTEAARKDLIGRTLAQTSNNAVMPKDKKRKFVMDIESRIAATIGFTPPQVWKE